MRNKPAQTLRDPLLPGTPELCDGDLSGGALHPGPRAGREGDGGHLSQHAGPGGLRGAAETVRLPLLPFLPFLPFLPQLLPHCQVRISPPLLS